MSEEQMKIYYNNLYRQLSKIQKNIVCLEDEHFSLHKSLREHLIIDNKSVEEDELQSILDIIHSLKQEMDYQVLPSVKAHM